MKRFLILLITVFLALFVLISCNKDNFNQDGGHYGGTNTDNNTNESSDTSTDTADTNTDTSVNTDSNTDTSTNDDSDVSSDSSSDTNTDTSTETNTDTDTEIEEVDGEIIKDEKGLLYMIKSDGTLKVVAFEAYEGMPGSFAIPSSVQGYIVTEIGSYAFNGYGEIAAAMNSTIGFATIRIPETVTKIRKGAFNNCLDVKVQFDTTNSTMTRDEWLAILIIEKDSDHAASNPKCSCIACQVYDTIIARRPAIGWYPYVK